MDPDRIYRHFCMMARALELVGERWSLLIVRDLLLGPRRFTDLARSLSEITPTRLTNRLRQLEAAGIVSREPPSAGREVWYRLTDAGHDLEPVVEALTLWGIRHAPEPPRRAEPVPSAAVMIGTKVWLQQRTDQPAGPLVWVWQFVDDDSYTLRATEDGWTLERGHADDASVTVETTLADWGRLLTSPVKQRRLPTQSISVTAKRTALNTFAKSFSAKVSASSGGRRRRA